MPDNIILPSLDIPTIETPFLSNDSIIALDIDTKNRYDKVFSGGSNPMPYTMPNYQAGTGSPSQKQILNNSFSRGTLGQALVSPNRKVRDMASDFVNYKTSYNNPARYNIGVAKVIQYDPAMDKYINGKFGYNPNLGIEGNEQLYYQDYLSKNIFSRSLSNIGTFLGRFGTGVAAKTVGTFGYLGSMIGNGIEELFNSEGNNAMADIANNSLSRWAEVNWEENWKNSAALSVFKPNDWEEKGFWSKLGNGAFWTDEVADGAAFMGEMILSTYLTGGLGKIAGLGKLGATGINTASRLSKFGKFAGGTGKVIDWTLKTATGADDIAGMGRWAFLTTSESAVESAGKYRSTKDDLYRKREQGIGRYKNMTDYQIENEAGDVAAASFKGNMMVLAASNAFENRFIFNKIFGTKKLDDADNAVFGKARTKNISIATGGKTLDDIGKASMKEFKYTTKLGKFFDWKNGLSRSRFYGWMGLRAMGAEGLWEENAQLAIERLSNDDYYRRMNPVRQFLGIVGTSEKQAFNAFAGEDVEASTAIGLGTIIGLGGGAVVSKIFGGSKDGKLKFFKGERKQVIEDTENLITRYEDARGKMFSFNKIWKKVDGKLTRDANGNLEIDESAAASVLQSLGGSMDHLSRIDEIQNPALRQKMMDDLMVDFVFAAKKAGIFERSIESINRIKDYTEEDAIELGFDPSSMADHKKVIDSLNLTGKLYDQVYNNARNKTYTNNDDLIDEENRKYFSFREKSQIEAIKRAVEDLTAAEQEFVIQNLDFTNPERSRSDIREINTLRLQLYRLEEFEKEAILPLQNDLFSEHIKSQKEKIKKELDRLEPLYKEDIKDKKLENIRPEGSPIDILYTTEKVDDWRLDNLYFKGLIDSIGSVGSLRNALAQSEYLDSFIDVSNEKSLENYRKLKEFRNEVNGLTNLTFLEERIAVIKKSIDDLKSKAVLTDVEQKELAGYEEQLKKLEEVYMKAVEKRNKEEEAAKGAKTESATEVPKQETEEEKVAREAKEKEQEDKEEENIKGIVNLLSTMSTDDKEEDMLKKEEDLKKLFGNIKNYELTITGIKELLDKGINENQINAIVNAIDDLSLEDEFNDLLLYINTKEEEREQKEGEEEQPEEKEIVVSDEIDNLEKDNTKPPEAAPVVTPAPTAPVSDEKADIPLGKINNTKYEVKTDGVYYQDKKLDNPENKTHRQLIEADIERRKQEELRQNLSKTDFAVSLFPAFAQSNMSQGGGAYMEINFGKNIVFRLDTYLTPSSLNGQYPSITNGTAQLYGEMSDGTKISIPWNQLKDLLNSIKSVNTKGETVYEFDKNKINAKYDAELAALEKSPTATVSEVKSIDDIKNEINKIENKLNEEDLSISSTRIGNKISANIGEIRIEYTKDEVDKIDEIEKRLPEKIEADRDVNWAQRYKEDLAVYRSVLERRINELKAELTSLEGAKPSTAPTTNIEAEKQKLIEERDQRIKEEAPVKDLSTINVQFASSPRGEGYGDTLNSYTILLERYDKKISLGIDFIKSRFKSIEEAYNFVAEKDGNKINYDKLRERLTSQLGRTPTKEELDKFVLENFLGLSFLIGNSTGYYGFSVGDETNISASKWWNENIATDPTVRVSNPIWSNNQDFHKQFARWALLTYQNKTNRSLFDFLSDTQKEIRDEYQQKIDSLEGAKPAEEQSIIGEQVGDFIIREEDGKWKIYNKDGESLGLSYNTKEEAINEINKAERTKKVYDSQLDDNIQELKSATKEEKNEILETIARDINRVVEVNGKLQYDPNATDAADRIAAMYHPKIIKLANDTFPKYKKIVEEYEKELIRKQNEPISDDIFEQFRNGSVDPTIFPTILQSIAKKDLENPDSLSDREKIIRDAKQKEIAEIKKVLLNQDDTKIVPKENTPADYQNQENFVDKHSDKRKSEGQFSFISTGPQEVIMKGDKPVVVDNVVQTQAGTGTEKEKYRRYRNVIEKHGNDFRPEANKKFRLKLLTVNDNNRSWFIATSASTSLIAVITDSQGRIISFDEQGNINPKGTPLAFEFSMAEYSSRTDKTGTPNILLKRSSIILGGNEKVEGEPGTRPFFDELWEKKTNEATINNTSEVDFDPTRDIVNLLKSGVEIFADFDTVLNSKLSSSRVNNSYSVKADENFETEAKTLQELIDLGFLDENAFPIIESTSIRYFEDSAGQNVKVGAPYFPAPGSKLKIPLFGKKIKDLTIGGNRIYSSETGELYSFGRVIQFIQDSKFVKKNEKTTDKVYRIPRSEFLQRSGTEAQSIFREITDEEFEKIYNYLNDLFYSEDIEFAMENEELVVRDKRPVKIPLSEYRINMNDVDFNIESREFIFNDERFGEEYTYSYLSFVKENFISNSLPANIGEQNGKPVINFAKLNRRVIFTLEYSYPEIEAKLKNINVKPEPTPQKADPQTEETIKKSSDIASENKNGFGTPTDNITFEC